MYELSKYYRVILTILHPLRMEQSLGITSSIGCALIKPIEFKQCSREVVAMFWTVI